LQKRAAEQTSAAPRGCSGRESGSLASNNDHRISPSPAFLRPMVVPPEPFSLLDLILRGYERFQMIPPLAMLAVESGAVVALRIIKLMLGGRDALYEAELMVSEKVSAAFEATASVMAGASGDDVIHRYRQHVAANAARLASPSA
jgi:hypothetical protein